uniref:LisH domain-containing protein n=1 Tax=Anolis carolinensis TaxID=28377 RepID=A0A803TIU8_ANOCA
PLNSGGKWSSFLLALYVYEYLLHVGAQKSAQTFLSESLLGFYTRGGGKSVPFIFLSPPPQVETSAWNKVWV